MKNPQADIEHTLRTVHKKCSGAAKVRAIQEAYRSFLEGHLTDGRFLGSSRSGSEIIIEGAVRAGLEAEQNASFYDEAMYGPELPKNIAMARVAVWSAVKDVLDASVVLTDGQLTTICDAAPLIVGRHGMEELSSVSNDAEMSAFITKNGPGYERGVMVAAQTWSLFHTATGTWPKNLLFNSKVEDENAALLGLVAGRLNAGDLENRMDARETLSQIAGQAHMVAELARSGRPNENPSSPEDAAATLIHLAREGDYLQIAASRLDSLLPEAAPSPATVEAYGLNRGMSQATHVEGDRLGDGGFLGYRTLGELRNKFRVASLSGDTRSTKIYSSHPYTHATEVKFRPWASVAAEFGGSVGADDVFSAALRGKHACIENYYSPIFTAGFDSDRRFDTRDYAQKISPDMAKIAKNVANELDLALPPIEITDTFYSSFLPVDEIKGARFAESNHFSKKYVLELLDATSLVKKPSTALFKEMRSRFKEYSEDGMSYEAAKDAMEKATEASLRNKFFGPLGDDPSEEAWSAAYENFEEKRSQISVFSHLVAAAPVISLDQRLGDGGKSDLYERSIIGSKKGGFDEIEESYQGEEGEETERITNGILTSESISYDEYYNNQLSQIREVLTNSHMPDLAQAFDGLASLKIPSPEEHENIERILQEDAESEEVGTRLANIYKSSANLIRESLRAENNTTPDMFGSSEEMTPRSTLVQDPDPTKRLVGVLRDACSTVVASKIQLR